MRFTPATLREHARDLRHAAENETDIATKRKCACDALVLAQLAEHLERTDLFMTRADVERYKALLADILDDDQRLTIEELLKQAQARRTR